MTRPVRVPVVALLAALAALLAPLGAAPAVSAGHAARSTVAGSGHASTTPAPAGRVHGTRELRDGAARRWQQDETLAQLTGARSAVGTSHGGWAAGVLAVVALAVAAAWWARRTREGRAPAGRTTGIRRGRGPPALACA